jgi:4-amino-4-deoxy-L-arabinose transferase-like glycosyltransferase
MNVARNWVEFGHYGQLNAGQPAPPGLSAAFPVVIPIALSFKVFGIGAWQARLPGVLFLFSSLVLLTRLGFLLYNQRVTLAVIGVLLLMSGFGQLHPLHVSRAVLGEIPMLFFLLVGWSCLLGALRVQTWLLVPAIFFWG